MPMRVWLAALALILSGGACKGEPDPAPKTPPPKTPPAGGDTGAPATPQPTTRSARNLKALETVAERLEATVAPIGTTVIATGDVRMIDRGPDGEANVAFVEASHLEALVARQSVPDATKWKFWPSVPTALFAARDALDQGADAAEALEPLEYLVVLRGEYAPPTVDAKGGTFLRGSFRGGVLVFRLADTTFVGGYRLRAANLDKLDFGGQDMTVQQIVERFERDLRRQIERNAKKGLMAFGRPYPRLFLP